MSKHTLNPSGSILEVRGLKTYFRTDEGILKAVDGVDLTLEAGQTLGIVGESGCGKSITALSVMRLIQAPQGEIVDGEIFLRGENILEKTEDQLRHLRGNEMSMIFQEPMTSLNPTLEVGEQIAEAVRIHQKLGKREAWSKAVEMLKLVGIPSPEKCAHQYPYELSGGMRQRVMIAIALSCNPHLLIADEPTTALDVTIQAQILDLLKKLQKDMGTAVIMITHDLGVVAETCDQVAVMYAGKVVEHTDVYSLFESPKHPYTIGLINSIPSLEQDQEQLTPIKGNVPSLYDTPSGCLFAPRCTHTRAICMNLQPELTAGETGKVRCWMYTEQWDESLTATAKEV